jgi:hypothetical protein
MIGSLQRRIDPNSRVLFLPAVLIDSINDKQLRLTPRRMILRMLALRTLRLRLSLVFTVSDTTTIKFDNDIFAGKRPVANERVKENDS